MNKMDIQTTEGIVTLATNGLTILLMIIAVSMAIRKKNNICLAVVILGNLIAYYLTQSPLICMIISIAGIIWASMSKNLNDNKQINIVSNKQPLKSSKTLVNDNKKMVKPGPIIGLIIGILMAGFPIVGFMIGEASLSDPQGKMWGFGFIIFGAFMVIVNVIALAKGTDNILNDSNNTTTTTTVTSSPSQVRSSRAKSQSEESSTNKIRCRFCKKLYSSEYNGCPFCKKK